MQKKNSQTTGYLMLVIMILVMSCTKHSKTVSVFINQESPKEQFALNEVEKALAEKGFEVAKGAAKKADIAFSIEPENTSIQHEGFKLEVDAGEIHIIATDEAGLMYGGIELAEQIQIYGLSEVKETLQNPYMKMRGTKFNIPLDVRTPSYSDPCDAAQNNMAEMWNIDFWKEYIDNMARHRYNYISLWSLHPFPSMVKVPDYPEVALDDVLRSTCDWEEYYSPLGIGFDAPEIVDHTEVLKEISIDEKIEFWQHVMAYAKDRNVDFYIVTWNIFTNGTEGKYGIDNRIDNEVTRDYFRKSVKQMFVTYAHLAGIGLTTGENMPGISVKDKEDWAFDTYALGILDAAEEMPDRKFKFIHRQHQTGAKDIAERFKPIVDHENIDFLFSFKYAKAHVMSATKQPYHEGFVKDIEGMKTIWTLRNDDNFYFRWGAPDFVREFIHNIPYEVSEGFYYGSDNYIWGREFLMKEAEDPRQLEVVKHWYHWMMWGRLGYNPELSNERFKAILAYRFPEVDATNLLSAWQEASMIYPITTGFHWGTIDLKWYIEGCRSTPRNSKTPTGYHDVNTFIDYPVHEYSECLTIPAYVDSVVLNISPKLKSPFEVSAELHEKANHVFELLKPMNPGTNNELKYTLHDIQTMACLGKYYAHKIAGSTNLALYRKTKDKNYQEKAVYELEEALTFWKKYAELVLEQYHSPLWTNRVGYVDFEKTIDFVKQDIELAKAN